jgi:hypothetical protein
LKIGQSGGLSVRWCSSYAHDKDNRRLPIIVEETFSDTTGIADLNFDHPFVNYGLKLTYCGIQMPNKISDWRAMGLLLSETTTYEKRQLLERTIVRMPPPALQPTPAAATPADATPAADKPAAKKVGKPFDFTRKTK